MKNFLLLICAMLIAATVIISVRIEFSESEETAPPIENSKPEAEAPKEKDMTKAIWISQYDLASVYLDGNTQRSSGEFAALVGQILDNCKALGFDTVIVQTRPNGDSTYRSELFCPSAYLTGEYGRELRYDPFDIIVSLCKIRGLSIHAWVNPLRLMRADEIEAVGEKYLIKKWHEGEKNGRYVVEFEGRLYLNPAYPEVRELIAAGAAELVRNYPIDGVHIDDYFYPHGIDTSFDAEAYEKYGGGLSLADWRRKNISSLVSEIYSSVKAVRAEALFGVSPGGNLKTVFNTDYADVYEWCGKKGYIDYICPQIYFGMEHESCAFGETLEKWESIVTEDSVSLFVGITFGKAQNGALGIEDKYAGSGRREWINSRRVLADCLEFAVGVERLDGVFVFCYQYFYDPQSGEKNENISAELESFLPIWKEID